MGPALPITATRPTTRPHGLLPHTLDPGYAHTAMREHLFRSSPPKRPRRLAFALTLTLLTLALGGCPEDTAEPADTSDTTPSGRSFLLATRAESYDIARARPFVASLDSLTFPAPPPAEPADPANPVAPNRPDRPIEALVLPVDLIGIPWTSFNGPDNRPGSLPAPWLAELDAMAALADSTDLPLIVAISPLADTHDTLSPLASDGSGALVLNPTWKPSCYDPSTDSNPTQHRDQFAGFAVWLAERLQPDAIILGQRLNLYEANCGASAFAALKGFVAHAHSRLQAASTVTLKPLTIATFDVEDLYGFPARAGRCVSSTPKDCLATRAALLADLGVDRLGLESHPFRAFAELAAIPNDWLAAVAAAQPSPALPALVASTGVPAARLDAQRGACAPFIESSENAQRAWLDQAIAFSTAQEAPYLVWRTLIDPLPTATLTSCPCSGTVADCTHLDGLGNRKDDRRALLSSGLAASDATARQALSLWRGLLER